MELPLTGGTSQKADSGAAGNHFFRKLREQFLLEVTSLAFNPKQRGMIAVGGAPSPAQQQFYL